MDNNIDNQNRNEENNINNNNIIQENNIQNESNISQNISDNITNNNFNDNNNNDIIGNNNNQENNNNNHIITNENLEEDNNNNSIVNDSINIEDEEIVDQKFNPIFTFSFKLYFILNTISYYFTYYKENKIKNFSLCLWPIFYKNQYFRIISCHFIYEGFLDYFLSMLGLFYITKYLEREIGSMYLLLISFQGMILSSIFYLCFMLLFKYFLRAWIHNFIEQCSFSGIDFCLFLSYFLLKKNKSRDITINSLDFKGTYLVYIAILLLQFMNPSAMFILNISGVLAAFCIFKLSKYYTLPKNKWICETEKILCLDDNKNYIKNILGYYAINDDKNIIENVKEFDNLLN